jgi:hypothetical protein
LQDGGDLGERTQGHAATLSPKRPAGRFTLRGRLGSNVGSDLASVGRALRRPRGEVRPFAERKTAVAPPHFECARTTEVPGDEQLSFIGGALEDARLV